MKVGCVTCLYDGTKTSKCLECDVQYKMWMPIEEYKISEDQRPIYSLEGYQRDAMRTAGMENQIYRYGNFALGIAGEAGEVADYIKKVLYHGHVMDEEVLCKELGDVLWYVTTLASTAGLTLEEVARKNIEKLRKRYPDGFSQEKSINREEEK